MIKTNASGLIDRGSISILLIFNGAYFAWFNIFLHYNENEIIILYGSYDGYWDWISKIVFQLFILIMKNHKIWSICPRWSSARSSAPSAWAHYPPATTSSSITSLRQMILIIWCLPPQICSHWRVEFGSHCFLHHTPLSSTNRNRCRKRKNCFPSSSKETSRSGRRNSLETIARVSFIVYFWNYRQLSKLRTCPFLLRRAGCFIPFRYLWFIRIIRTLLFFWRWNRTKKHVSSNLLLSIARKGHTSNLMFFQAF